MSRCFNPRLSTKWSLEFCVVKGRFIRCDRRAHEASLQDVKEGWIEGDPLSGGRVIDGFVGGGRDNDDVCPRLDEVEQCRHDSADC